MAGYVHRSQRGRPQAPDPWEALPADLQDWLTDAAAEQIVAHQQALRAGVPGCACGAVYSGYPTMHAEHARHTARIAAAAAVTALHAAGALPTVELAAVR